MNQTRTAHIILAMSLLTGGEAVALVAENRAYASPFAFATLLTMAIAFGLLLLGLPLWAFRKLRGCWPRHPAFVHGILAAAMAAVIGLCVQQLITGRSFLAIPVYEYGQMLAVGLVGYGLLKLTDFIVIRRVQRRFPKLSRIPRLFLAFIVVTGLAYFAVWCLMIILWLAIPNPAVTYPQLQVPVFDAPPIAAPDQPVK